MPQWSCLWKQREYIKLESYEWDRSSESGASLAAELGRKSEAVCGGRPIGVALLVVLDRAGTVKQHALLAVESNE